MENKSSNGWKFFALLFGALLDGVVDVIQQKFPVGTVDTGIYGAGYGLGGDIAHGLDGKIIVPAVQQHAESSVDNAVFRDNRRRTGNLARKVFKIMFKAVHRGNVAVLDTGLHAVCAEQFLGTNQTGPERKGMIVEPGQQHAVPVRHEDAAFHPLDALFRPVKQLKYAVHHGSGMRQDHAATLSALFQLPFGQDMKLRPVSPAPLPAAQP